MWLILQMSCSSELFTSFLLLGKVRRVVPTTHLKKEMTTDFERLERLEQAITLCLQEIDHNFIRCHRVATACLPVVERYAEQSRSVWDGAKVAYTRTQNILICNIVLETIL